MIVDGVLADVLDRHSYQKNDGSRNIVKNRG